MPASGMEGRRQLAIRRCLGKALAPMVPFPARTGKYTEFSPDYYHAILCQVAQGTSPDNLLCDGFAETRRARSAVGQTLSLAIRQDCSRARKKADDEDD